MSPIRLLIRSSVVTTGAPSADQHPSTGQLPAQPAITRSAVSCSSTAWASSPTSATSGPCRSTFGAGGAALDERPDRADRLGRRRRTPRLLRRRFVQAPFFLSLRQALPDISC